jgi:hypothetical protein
VTVPSSSFVSAPASFFSSSPSSFVSDTGAPIAVGVDGVSLVRSI